MSKLLRPIVTNHCFFVTSVTHNRMPILLSHSHLLLSAFNTAQTRLNFLIPAWIILPDHFHAIISTNETSISTIMQTIKMSFSANYRNAAGLQGGKVWQRRFWDHVLRDENDLNRHLDYIHYNPVKHGLVEIPSEYIHSSFGDYLKRGSYSVDWGLREGVNIEGEFGE